MQTSFGRAARSMAGMARQAGASAARGSASASGSSARGVPLRWALNRSCRKGMEKKRQSTSIGSILVTVCQSGRIDVQWVQDMCSFCVFWHVLPACYGFVFFWGGGVMWLYGTTVAGEGRSELLYDRRQSSPSGDLLCAWEWSARWSITPAWMLLISTGASGVVLMMTVRSAGIKHSPLSRPGPENMDFCFGWSFDASSTLDCNLWCSVYVHNVTNCVPLQTLSPLPVTIVTYTVWEVSENQKEGTCLLLFDHWHWFEIHIFSVDHWKSSESQRILHRRDCVEI